MPRYYEKDQKTGKIIAERTMPKEIADIMKADGVCLVEADIEGSEVN